MYALVIKPFTILDSKRKSIKFDEIKKVLMKIKPEHLFQKKAPANFKLRIKARLLYNWSNKFLPYRL